MTGTLSVIYINRSIMECVDAATTRTEAATAGPAVCDLKADGRTLVLLLSVLTVRTAQLHPNRSVASMAPTPDSVALAHLAELCMSLTVGSDVRRQDGRND